MHRFIDACIDDAPYGGSFLEDAWSYNGECGHVLVHMKVNLAHIYCPNICWGVEKLT